MFIRQHSLHLAYAQEEKLKRIAQEENEKGDKIKKLPFLRTIKHNTLSSFHQFVFLLVLHYATNITL